MPRIGLTKMICAMIPVVSQLDEHNLQDFHLDSNANSCRAKRGGYRDNRAVVSYGWVFPV